MNQIPCTIERLTEPDKLLIGTRWAVFPSLMLNLMDTQFSPQLWTWLRSSSVHHINSFSRHTADNIHRNLLTFFSLLTVKARAPKEVVEQTASRTNSSFTHGFNTSTADMIQSGEPGEKTAYKISSSLINN